MTHSELLAQEKELRKIMEKLGDAVVLVEGKKDQYALEPYAKEIFQISSGKVRSACEKVSETGVREAVVLTDRDKTGEELAKFASEELERYGIRADLETRKRLMGILRLTYVENFGKKYDEKMKEFEEN